MIVESLWENVQVLEVAAGELVVGNDLDLAITGLGDLDGLAEVTDAALNLDLLVQELLEGGDIEDLVAGGLRSVDNELVVETWSVAHSSSCDRMDGWKLTFLVVLGPFLAADFLCNNHNDLAYCFTPWFAPQQSDTYPRTASMMMRLRVGPTAKRCQVIQRTAMGAISTERMRECHGC